MFAAVDLGSNSFRLHIGYHDGNTVRVVKTARDPVRLGNGMDKEGNLTAEAQATALLCLRNFRQILSEHPLSAVRVVATNTLRVAKNASEFLPLAEAAIGCPIEVISGEEEGRLIYMGVSSSLDDDREKRLVIDIGGGSTEVILGRGPDILHVESFSIGTANHSARFFPSGDITVAAFDDAVLSARSCFEDAAPSYVSASWEHAYGTSGTMRAIADAIAKNDVGDRRMSYESLVALKALLINARHLNNVVLQGVKPERLPAVVSGLAILLGVMAELGIASLTAVNAGLRVGVLADLQLRASRQDRRDVAVRDFATRFYADNKRGTQVADAAVDLYARLKPDGDTYARSLYWSAFVHEVGLSVSHTGYHKHGAYLVENADLAGFTNREQRIMSILVLGQKGNLRKLDSALQDPDLMKAVVAFRIAVILMHARTCTEASEVKLKVKGRSRIEIELPRAWVALHPTFTFAMQKERDWWDEVGVEFLLKTG